MKFLTTLLLVMPFWTLSAENVTRDFEWKDATVYFLITDRFCNGDTCNDVNYGRRTDYGSEQMNAATFHGGDLAGIRKKAEEGYFKQLGIDVVWMTDVYEQIHGWMSGSGEINDFPHYGYHGYYSFDYTQLDKNYGTSEELRALVDTLHAQGIRVMLGANLNNPGYPTLLDAVQYNFATTGVSETSAAEHIPDWSYDKFYEDRGKWNGWYDRGWIRMPDELWDESNPLEATLYGLPDFKDESNEPVKIPEFLRLKWKSEGHDNDKWINPTAAKLRGDLAMSPMQHLIGWISAWVEEYGIDGFRCDIVENVRVERWKELSDACNQALSRWRQRHPDDPASKWTSDFYFTGDIDPTGIEYREEYSKAGFGSMVNCYFPKSGDLDAITYVWQAYADSMAAHEDWHPFSYLNNSYHRDALQDNMADCATSLLLAPGAVQIFYGDESGRELSDARFNVDSAQAYRSDMNWASSDSTLLRHYSTLGGIRKAHPAIGRGRQEMIDEHTCARLLPEDTVVIALRPEPGKSIHVKPYFEDGMAVENLYTGEISIVQAGKVLFDAGGGNVAVVARAQ